MIYIFFFFGEVRVKYCHPIKYVKEVFIMLIIRLLFLILIEKVYYVFHVFIVCVSIRQLRSKPRNTITCLKSAPNSPS